MCKCTPEIRTPFCGKLGCEWPEPTVAPEEMTQQKHTKEENEPLILKEYEKGES